MKKIIKKILLLILFSFVLSFSSNLHAQTYPSTDEYKNVKKGLFLKNSNKTQNANNEFKSISQDNFGQSVTMQQLMADYEAGEYLEIFEKVKDKAEEGNPEATELLGIMYRFGQGVEKNPKEAFAWLKRAAEFEKPLAQMHLGLMFFNAEASEKNIIKALKWLKISTLLFENDNENKIKAVEEYKAILSEANRRERSSAVEEIKDWLYNKNKIYLLEN